MTLTEFFTLLCLRFHWEPTAWRLAVFARWAAYEGMTNGTTPWRTLEYNWNPLATTRRSAAAVRKTDDAGYGPGNWNSIGVGIYAHAEAGLAATYETLTLGYYINIRRCFQDQQAYEEAVPEFVTYVGSEAYGRALVDYMRELPEQEEPMNAQDKAWVLQFGHANGGRLVRKRGQPGVYIVDHRGKRSFPGGAAEFNAAYGPDDWYNVVEHDAEVVDAIPDATVLDR